MIDFDPISGLGDRSALGLSGILFPILRLAMK